VALEQGLEACELTPQKRSGFGIDAGEACRREMPATITFLGEADRSEKGERALRLDFRHRLA
jgi:hypothetical protein